MENMLSRTKASLLVTECGVSMDAYNWLLSGVLEI